MPTNITCCIFYKIKNTYNHHKNEENQSDFLRYYTYFINKKSSIFIVFKKNKTNEKAFFRNTPTV